MTDQPSGAEFVALFGAILAIMLCADMCAEKQPAAPDVAPVEPSPLQDDPDRPPSAAPRAELHADVARGRCACAVAIGWPEPRHAHPTALETCDLIVDEALLAGVDPVLAVAIGYHESRLDWRRANTSVCCGAMQVKATYDTRPTCMELVADPRLGVRTGLEIFVDYERDLAAYNAGRAGARAGRGRGYASAVRGYEADLVAVCDRGEAPLTGE